MLLAVGVATGMARSLTRPLAVLRLGSKRLAEAEDPAAEEPVKFTGRNDEFAQVVRSVNALHAHAAALTERITTLESDRKHLVGQRQKMADAREELRGELAESAAQLERLRTAIGGTFVNLALRTLGLVERQLAVIENLEEREQDPDRLATLFKLDHFATVMRRHSENLLVLAGTEHVQHAAGPVPLVDVVRAAVSEIERYERVRIAALPPHAHIAGFAADDLSHLLAELMENATSFSPPDLPVEISGWLLENGEVMLSVQDEGIGMTEERLERLNSRLADFDPEAPYDQEGEDGLGLGLYVVARLAHRHGVRVQLREQKQGGVAAVVVLPRVAARRRRARQPSRPPAPSPARPTPCPSRAPTPRPTPTSCTAARTAATRWWPWRRRRYGGRRRRRSPSPRSPGRSRTRRRSRTPRRSTRSRRKRTYRRHRRNLPQRPRWNCCSRRRRRNRPRHRWVRPGPPRGWSRSRSRRSTNPQPPTASPPCRGRPNTTSKPARGVRVATTTPKAKPRLTQNTNASPTRASPSALRRSPHPTTAPRQRSGSVDADALRRRLGGFRQGAQAGYRDVEAEIADRTASHKRPATGTAGPAEPEEATGGTVEEASS